MTFEQMFKFVILVILAILFLGAICSVGSATGNGADEVSEWPVTCTPEGCSFETPEPTSTPLAVCEGYPPKVVPCVWPTVVPPPTQTPCEAYPGAICGYPPAVQSENGSGAIWLPLLFGGDR